MELVFATGNKHKIKEISALLGNNIKLISLEDLKIPDNIPEDFDTLEENAMAKARYIHNLTGMDVFADDTGLEVKSLGGKPGVFSARFAGEEKNFDRNIEKVLELMKDENDREAMFRTVIALIKDNKEFLFEGNIKGTILKERRGNEGFGYDPIFLPDGYNQTFAEMSLDDKNKISHRALAFMKLKDFLLQH
ncbi:MAG TPA: non-canonical purine NTP diphosphatase [Bacteroidales bacterium]|nr:non-canonical purine NTP diphosphatase [Bacteroidales bacterium]HCI54862.1 non-canonical purine NTP pyrophosphatase [Bacteroidales bacterium]HOU95695.1 non-canonical purine NTP diphosphatase [Bacteroidales bacterium]HQG37392.1 non-canonical purine NTP diphosphatase [Bacteroidales bacterium]HQG52120.1 non-canonical purine NTP diphosphatase [Bacteroidales bacterium]